MKYDALDKINELKDKGILTEEEFVSEKAKILNDGNDEVNKESAQTYWGMSEKNFAMAIHLSQLTSFFIPLLGFILPIVMWSIYKEQSAFIDQNGKDAVNWIISATIYIIVSIFLILVIIGIPLLILLCILNFVFCIMAGVKASSGKTWKYPMSIKFI